MENRAAQPKDAATVILLRKSRKPKKGNFEVLLVLRNTKSRFVPGSYVFPGGCLEDEDAEPEMERFLTGVDPKKARALFPGMSSPDKAPGIWVAAIRETFEEAGMLMAYRRDNAVIAIDSDPLVNKFRSYRQHLREGIISFKNILLHEGLTLAIDRLHYFSHWITPELLPLRYNVRFFLAEAPPNQNAVHDGTELTGHVWITPQEALEAFKHDRLDMVVPILVTIEELAGYKTIDDAIGSTGRKEIHPILTVMVEEAQGIVEYMSDGRVFRHMPPSILP
jgi:8-oxo-dGTP pyrophosphatase MutT (NUDIX family)